MVGIVSYGTYIPKNRLKISEIEGGSVGLEKAVAGMDEDAATLAVEASLRAIISSGLLPEDIKAIAVGSESHPYAVKPTATTVGEVLGISGNYLAVDTQFACKAATSAFHLLFGLEKDHEIKFGLVIGTDTAQAKMGDVLEYTAGSGAGAFILGDKQVIAKLIDCTTYSTNTLDFWRRDTQKYPSHAGRFSGEMAYFHHILAASNRLLEKLQTKPDQFDQVVFHMPNVKFPREVAKRLGFTDKQLEIGFLVDKIGNPYSASALLGLAAVLDKAKPKQKIFVCSYGSGAGSDAFAFEVTDKILEFQKKNKHKIQNQIEDKNYISYQQYLKILMAKGYI